MFCSPNHHGASGSVTNSNGIGARSIIINVDYRFPNRLPPSAQPKSLRLSMEVCSEAPLYHLDWLSDATVWINGVEVGTWTSPAGFGGEQGLLTPEWWTPRNTQYGLLKIWHVNGVEAEIGGMHISDVTVNDLHLHQASFIRVRIGMRSDAAHAGGLNLFGHKFGNYPQDIVLRMNYRMDDSLASFAP